LRREAISSRLDGDGMSKSDIQLLGISGSPRLKSTHYAVNAALEYARDRHGVQTDYFSVSKKVMGFCTHCDFCVRKKQGCVQDDAMTEVYEKLKRADALILGSPVYQGHVSGQLKTLLDRCRAVVAADPAAFRDKVGMGIAVGGDRNGGQEPTLQSLTDFYLINGMIPVGGGAFGANLGAAVWSRDKGIAGVKADAEGVAAVYRVVDRLVEMTQLVQACRS
jgi:multimeric flavodoxin WrbA